MSVLCNVHASCGHHDSTCLASAGFSSIDPPQTTTAGSTQVTSQLSALPPTCHMSDRPLTLVACDQYPVLLGRLQAGSDGRGFGMCQCYHEPLGVWVPDRLRMQLLDRGAHSMVWGAPSCIGCRCKLLACSSMSADAVL